MNIINSMTAFGRSTASDDNTHIEWELKSLNNRYLELNFRLPESFRSSELSLREHCKKALARGKVDISLRINHKTQNSLAINTALLGQLQQTLNDIEIAFTTLTTPTALDILQWPGLLTEVEHSNIDALVIDSFHQALSDLHASRTREGEQLHALITQRVSDILALVATLENHLPALQQKQHQRLVDKLNELGLNHNNERVEQELVILANKSDVAEELDRLRTHCAEITRILEAGGACGRRLDFMMQELNREANTLGSKAIGTEVTQAAIDLKVLIEQIREQVQNIE